MFSTVHYLLGNINIDVRGNYISIQGLPQRGYMNDIYALWKTSKITEYMFIRHTKTSVTFHQFFLPDVLYTLETIVSKPRRGSGTNYRILRKVIEELKKNTWLSRVDQKQPDILDFKQIDKINVKLLDHQDDFLHLYNDMVPRYNLMGYMLAAIPGSGKTLTGISLSLCLKADVTICVVPKNSVERVWEATLQEFFKKPVTYWSSASGEEIKKGRQFYICHYEQLDVLLEFFRQNKPLRPVVILDESHNFNDIDSLRVNRFIELCRKQLNCKHVLWASGTPIKALGTEAIPFLRTIDPLFDDEAEEAFRKIYGRSISRAVDILSNRIGFLTFKVEKNDVIKNEVETINKDIEMPKGELYTLEVIKEDMRAFVTQRMIFYKEHFNYYLDIYEHELVMFEKTIGKHYKLREDYEKYLQYVSQIRHGYDPATMKELVVYCNQFENKIISANLSTARREAFRNAKSVVKYYDLKVRGEALGRILGKKRAQCHVDMIPYCGLEEEIDQARKKTVIFTSYVEVVISADKYLKNKGYNPILVYGDTNVNLNALINQFDKDEDANPLIATFQSLSTAVPLLMASTVILMNSPFRSFEYDQATARLDRIGQDGSVTIVNMFLKTGDQPNISTRSGDIMEWSKEAVDAIMGRKTVLDDISLEVYSEALYELVYTHSLNPLWSKW